MIDLKQLFEIIIVLLLVTYFSKGLLELVNFYRAMRFVLEKKELVKVRNDNDLPFIYILLPVLREQKVINETIGKFLKINYPSSRFKIVVITTEKEAFEKQENRFKLEDMARKLSGMCAEERFVARYLGVFPENGLRNIYKRLYAKSFCLIINELKKEYDNQPTTIDLVREIKKEKENSNLEIVHYPNVKGMMAHQINYACSHLLKGEKSGESYICIYNADSEIDQNTFLEVSSIISKNKEKDFVIQQSALFLKNFKTIDDGMRKLFVFAGGLFQSYWTFSVEIPRIIKQNATISNKNLKLAHCVGHGLYIKLNLFRDLGMLPLDTLNEDLAFGFKLSAKRIPIYPLKCLEIGDTPETFRSLINQKKVWFHSYIEYYKARNLSLRNSNEKELVNNLFLQGCLYGCMWLLNSYFIILPLFYGLIFAEIYYFYIAILLLLIFNFVPYYLFIREVGNRKIFKNINTTYTLKEELLLSFFSVIIFLTDSIGPSLSLLERIKSGISGMDIHKKKTER